MYINVKFNPVTAVLQCLFIRAYLCVSLILIPNFSKYITYLISHKSRDELTKLFLVRKDDDDLNFYIFISGNIISSQKKLVSNQLNISEARLSATGEIIG